MMSIFPSVSQSISPTPPLIDSTMYFLSGEEMCATVRPAFRAMSSNFGTDACALEGAFFGGVELGRDSLGATCARGTSVSNPKDRKNCTPESESAQRESSM